jgi:hypothetical protein
MAQGVEKVCSITGDTLNEKPVSRAMKKRVGALSSELIAECIF